MCLVRFIESLLDPSGVHRDSHSTWIRIWGAGHSGTPGNWLILYTYDALGRLIRAQRPWPQPGPSGSYLRIEHYYYDGVRRLQEVFVDPVVPQTDKGTSSKDEKQAQPVVTNLTWTAREYIWGPDYVDELVAQIAPGAAQ